MLIEVGVLSVVLAASGQGCGAGAHVLSRDSSGVKSMTVSGSLVPNVSFGQSVEYALASDLALVPDVRHVLVERAEDNLLVWIALDSPTKEVREIVFQKQFDLIDGFPEVSFDFNLVSSKARKAEELASSAKLIYSREDE